MLVRAKNAAPAHKGMEPTPKVPAQPFSFPAPIAGWVQVGSPMQPVPQSARILDNYLCTTTGIEARGGATKHATLGAAATSLFAYRSGGARKMFGATASAVYDITTPADPDVAPAAQVTSQTSGDYSVVQIGTSGGDFLYAVNGSDYALLYDGTNLNPVTTVAINDLAYDALVTEFSVGETVTGGTSGASATIIAIAHSGTAGTLKIGTVTGGPFQDDEGLTSAAGEAVADGANSSASSITISGVDTSSLSATWTHANRLWFAESGSMSAWYLSVDSIGGTATEFPLRSVFRRGGTLLFGTSWSTNAGDGLDDKCIFVSSEGEVAIYSGTNPNSTTTWVHQGVYDIPEPLGKNAFARFGGDVAIATTTGLIPVSASIYKDINALPLAAISRSIAPYWQSQANSIASSTWQMAKVPVKNGLVISQPDTSDPDGSALWVNMQTGAWSRITGWDTRCVVEHLNQGYYGDGDGAVFLMNSGGSDNGTPYTCKYLGQFEHMNIPGALKTAVQARASFVSASPIVSKVSMHADFDATLPSAPGSPSNYTADTWDSGLWDTALWDSEAEYTSQMSWAATAATGTMIAPALQLTFGITPTPSVELSTIDVQFTIGAVVT